MKILPVLTAVFRRRKRPVGTSWRMDETYVKVAGQWKYLYRAVDRDGHTIDFLLRAKRDCAAARCFLERAIGLHGPLLGENFLQRAQGRRQRLRGYRTQPLDQTHLVYRPHLVQQDQALGAAMRYRNTKGGRKAL